MGLSLFGCFFFSSDISPPSLEMKIDAVSDAYLLDTQHTIVIFKFTACAALAAPYFRPGAAGILFIKEGYIEQSLLCYDTIIQLF